MDTLTLTFNKESLLELMRNFNTLTGIKLALFDINGNELLSYPQNHCPFCAFIRSYADGEVKCQESNRQSFERCQITRQLEIFPCHAGLIETTAPLIDNGAVIGYIMFGQITDNPDVAAVRSMLYRTVQTYKPDSKGLNADIYRASYKTRTQIEAAARILEACTFYVLLQDMVGLQRENFLQNLNEFLLSHLSEDLSVARLTDEFHVSKNKLYESCSRYLPTGIAEHIKKLRIEEAKRLLKETDLSVHEISDKVGFNDYNYFCRVFKAECGVSAGKFRSK